MKKQEEKNQLPVLNIVVPCYNEEEVLPITSVMFENKIKELIELGKISPKSCVLFVNDATRSFTVSDPNAKLIRSLRGLRLSLSINS